MHQEFFKKNYTIFTEETTSALAGFYAGPANADIFPAVVSLEKRQPEIC